MTKETTPANPETMLKLPDFDIVVARHAAYYDIAMENEMYAELNEVSEEERSEKEEKIKVKLGHLTETGKEQAKKLGLDVLREALATGEPTDITFIPSKQEYESPRHYDAPWAGKRAEETTVTALNAILEEADRLVEAGEIAQGQVNVVTPLPNEPFEEGDKPNQRLVERNVYWSPDSDTSLAEVYKKRTTQLIEQEQTKGQPLTSGYDTITHLQVPESVALSNREKEIWSRGQKDLDEFGKEIGNETSTEVAERILSVLKDMEELAEIHQQHNPDRRLVIVLVSHDATVGALSHQGFGTEKPVIPSFTDRLKIHVADGVANLEYDGNVYSKKITNDS